MKKLYLLLLSLVVLKQHAAFPPGPFQVPSGVQVSFFYKKTAHPDGRTAFCERAP